MNRYFASALVGIGVCGSAGIARAQSSPPAFALHWEAPEECPDDVQLVHQIEVLLGESLLETKGQALRVRASAHGNPSAGYAAKLSFTSAQGNEERFLEHPKCEKLVEASALIIALSIDPERVQATRQATEAGSAVAPSPTVPATIDVATAAQVPAVPDRAAASDFQAPTATRSLHGLRLAAHGLIGAGVVPGLGAGFEGTLAFQPRAFRIELAVRYWAPREQVIANTPDASLQVELATLGTRGCWLLPANLWRVSACGGADFGSYRARGIGVENSRQSNAFFGQLSGGVQVAYTRWALLPEGGLEVSGALVRPRFGVQRDGQPSEVFQPAAWAFTAFFGLAFEP